MYYKTRAGRNPANSREKRSRLMFFLFLVFAVALLLLVNPS